MGPTGDSPIFDSSAAQPAMKPQAKLAIIFALVSLSGAGGVVHMTSLPTPGEPGFVKPETPEYDQRLRTERLRQSVIFQCEEIGRRSSRWSVQGEQLLQHFEDALGTAGFSAERHQYRAGTQGFENVIGVKPGIGSETLLIATHYDSYSKSLCANGSATGVATVLEIVRSLRADTTDKTIIVGLFGTGEKPHGGREGMGANQWLQHAQEEGIKIDQAIIVSSFGKFNAGDGLQNSSFPWYLMYPKTADWVGIYGPATAKDDVKEALDIWGRVTKIPARGFASPAWMMGIPSTDQVPFQKAGIPTVLFSDTGAERDSNIRTRYDGPFEIDYSEMALRVEALVEVVKAYAGAS